MSITKTISSLFFPFMSVSTQAGEFISLWATGKKPNDNSKNVTDRLFNKRIWSAAK